MKTRPIVSTTLVAFACAIPTVFAMAGSSEAGDERQREATGLVREVRLATRDFHDVGAALAAGYSSAGSCVSGPEEGAMGVHFPNGILIGDGALDARRPEILVYEQRGGRLRLLGVEYVVIADAWHAQNPGPPVLMGQHFHYVGSPNRYGLPPFYELHVWAWKHNPHGMFVDWNPRVSCAEYTGEEMPHSASSHGTGQY
jgi:hypothetical protein